LHGRIVNLSEGGMAIRAGKPLKHETVIEFAFELAYEAEISGKAHVAWTSTEGMAGVLFQTLHGMARGHLGSWLTAREQLARNWDGGEKQE
jgi:hypothetical protein